MLFLWTTTDLGKIWLDGDAVKQLITKRLPQDFYVQEVSFIGEKNLLNVYIAVPEDTDTQTKSETEKKLTDIFGKSGISTQLSWVNVAPQDNKKTTPIWTLPLFWAGAAGGVTALFHMGISGILWAIFSAVIGYAIAWILITEDGQKQVAALKEHFRR